jgi:DNA-binding NarL/FixJ family response regulator
MAPQLIICDIHMPGMDGLTFLEKLYSRHKVAPVLVLTSDEDRTLEARLALLGVEAFVRKNEDPRVLLAWCKNLLKRAETAAAGDACCA